MEFVILPILLLTSFVALAVGATIYLLFAFGLYRMANNLGLPSPWMAFVPFASDYLLGLVAEKDSAGRSTLKYSWILLISKIVSTVFSGGYCVFVITSYIFGQVGALIIFWGLCAMCSIVSAVFYYIALYRVYKLFDPDNAPIFIILSVIFSISTPILMFILRNKSPQMCFGNPYSQVNVEE